MMLSKHTVVALACSLTMLLMLREQMPSKDPYHSLFLQSRRHHPLKSPKAIGIIPAPVLVLKFKKAQAREDQPRE